MTPLFLAKPSSYKCQKLIDTHERKIVLTGERIMLGYK